MAATVGRDPLLNLRTATIANNAPLLTKSADPSTADDAAGSIQEATHLHFSTALGQASFSLNDPTRFVVDGEVVDLRSIYVAWLNREASFPDYRSAVEALNGQLAEARVGRTIQFLSLSARLEFRSWVDGDTEESEYIQPLDAQAASAQADGSAAVAAGVAGGISSVITAAGQGQKAVDARLMVIYQGERRPASGNRNGALRGIKPTDFSHVRKTAETFIGRNRHRPGVNMPAPTPSLSNNPALVSRGSKPSSSSSSSKRLEPIILLSPSASSLLRINNIRPFLGDGTFIPASDPSLAGTSTNTILHITRSMPSIEPRGPLRFVLVDSPDQFKPDYWSRVVAVFTTGQQWQFRSYRWTNPEELFKHALGIYLGWTGEPMPDAVKSWGRSVMVANVDKYAASQGGQGRWRDREVVERIWSGIEEFMRFKGWSATGFAGANPAR